MNAIIVTGGKQYKVAEGDVVYIEKLNQEAGAATASIPATAPANVRTNMAKKALRRRSSSSG